ncbi:MAG: type III polyketide synthase [Parachlamydiaceae bacterium]|nr:type III polyketide synthase [Parachlamydiaceae bacterium]
MKASILALATAVPQFTFTQEEIAEKLAYIFEYNSSKTENLKKLYQNSAIHTRYSILSDFKKDRADWNFWGSDYPKTIPGMSLRNDTYKEEAPKLAYQAAFKALQDWGGDPSRITHVVSVSCTGVLAPGIEFGLIKKLGLNLSVNRLGINFMGCFGAFKGLSVAQSFAKENPEHRILLVCTELCSLHLQHDQSPDTLLSNSLFSDGAAAAVIGANPKNNEKVCWEITRQTSLGLENTHEKMSWEAGDHGFHMKLSHTVPVLLGRCIPSYVSSLLTSEINPAECDWPIHPGGKSIIQAIEKALQLNKTQTLASWDVLSKYGNMSSSTFLFVLDSLRRQSNKKKWAVGIGFGPGLSIEGILLHNPEHL